jgi:large subunit ribosomal protein L19
MNLNEVQKNLIVDKKVPLIKTGDIVRVVQEFEESGSAKQQIFEGVIISIRGEGLSKTFTVRKVTAGVGVEKTYPLYSPTIKKIQIKKSSKIKRAKLYWLRERVGKAARLQEKDLDPEVVKLMAAQEQSELVDKVNKVEIGGENKRSEAKSSVAESVGGDEDKKDKKNLKAEPKKAPSDSKDKS